MPKNPTVAHVWMACCRFRVVTRASSSAPCAPPRRSPRGRRSRRRRRAALTPRARRYARFAPTLTPLATSWTPLPSSGGGAIGPAVASPRPPRTSPTSTASRVPSRPRPRRLPLPPRTSPARPGASSAARRRPSPPRLVAREPVLLDRQGGAARVPPPRRPRPGPLPALQTRRAHLRRRSPKTGEEWIRAFGRREVSAAFPFGVLESVLNRLEVPFASGAARVAFARAEERNHLRMLSRVHVDFADGGLVGELVTACTLEPEETGDASPSSTGDASPSSTGDASPSTGDAFPSRRRACLETTTFEGTGTPLDGVSVPSGAIMRVLMSPSPRLRRMRGRGGAAPATTYRPAISDDGDAMVVLAGSCDETATVLVYARERESRRA